MFLSDRDRQIVVECAWDRVNDFKPDFVSVEGCCLYAAFATADILCHTRSFESGNYKVLVQAGTVQWPRLDPDQDDGHPTTMSHFSYVWEPHGPTGLVELSYGRMPEMHVWVAVLDQDIKTGWVVDITTRHLVSQCKSLIGKDWPGKRPPDFLWSRLRDIPDRVVYAPDETATRLAIEMFLQTRKR